jgi:hypothetical protein
MLLIDIMYKVTSNEAISPIKDPTNFPHLMKIIFKEGISFKSRIFSNKTKMTGESSYILFF